MIGRAKSNKSLMATINYNLKENAELFFINRLSGEDINDYRLQMMAMQKCYNGVAKTLTIHVILSPHISEGKNLDKNKWGEMADQYLNLMNLKEHQAIGFIHSDKEHRHLHLVINKVKGSNIKLYHDGFIGKRTQKAADAIAIRMNLIRAREIMRQNNEIRKKQRLANAGKSIPELEIETNALPIGSKQLFKQQLNSILQNRAVKCIEGYFLEIKNLGFKLYLYHNKETKQLRGYGIEKNHTKMDASTIGKVFTITNLERRFKENDLRAEEEAARNVKSENEGSERRGVRF